MKQRLQLIILFIMQCTLIWGCLSSRTRQTAEREVPIAITIRGNDPELTSANLDYYMFKVIDELERFQSIDLTSVEPEDKPEISLDVDIQNFTIWPKDQSVARRIFTRAVVIGSDAKGNPIYGTVRASADVVQEQWRANATFATKLSIKGNPGKTFSRVFTPNYRRRFVYVENIQGDMRAIDPSVASAMRPPFDPRADEILLELSKEEMLRRISNEIRSYYNKK